MRDQGDSESAFKPNSLVDLLRHRAIHRPADLAYTFIADEQELPISHKELDQSARILAMRLQEKAPAGERALLLYPSGLDFIKAFFACMYAGLIAVPLPPPPANRPMPRLRTVLEDAQPRLILTMGSLLDGVKSHFSHCAVEPDYLATDDIEDQAAVAWQPLDVSPDTIAMLQYTSGSTNTPKGVVLSHGNLVHNLSVICREFTVDRMSPVGLSWLPNYHDMGLIGGILAPLYIGGLCVLMAPFAFVNRPYRWLEAITRLGANVSGAPNFAYELCASKITPEQKAALDLSSWEIAYCGAEPIRYETVKRFTETFTPCGFRPEAFYPCYGLAEATLLVSGSSPRALPTLLNVEKSALEVGRVAQTSVEGSNARLLVSSGKVFAGQNVLIVDPESSAPCAPGKIGEVWLSGPSVAQGYWNQPEETLASFHARISETGEGPFLRTGDLGFIGDQELYITGRLKDLIIVGGRNIYPQDIETQVERCHPELGQGLAAAFSVADDITGEERLVVVREIGRHAARKVNFNDAIRAFRSAIAEGFDLQLYGLVFVRELTVPKTSSGKVQRFLCKKAYLEGTLAVLEQWRATGSADSSISGKTDNERTARKVQRSKNEIENWLISHLSLELSLPVSEIDPEQPFYSFGMDSIKAIGLAAALETWLGRTLPPTLAYDYPNIKALTNYLTGQAGGSVSSKAAMNPAIGTAEPIAIVGIGCRFPGADGPAAFWELLVAGVDCVTQTPAERRNDNAAGTYEKDGLYGGFLQCVDEFDAGFFEISAREATLMDPQQRLMLEMCWEAMDDARQTSEKLEGTQTGVFIGASNNDYGRFQFSDPSLSDPYAGTGNALSIIANRISYNFGLRGPSITVDTACSSSLVAIHLACQSIRNGECDSALVGGVNLILSPAITINFRDAGLMASDGRCKAFDSRADGYVRGEGAAMVLIKPLSKAVADGDRIYAVIKATAINQDGKTNGLTAPSYQAQKDVLLQAYRQAGVSPARVQYVEAHGTGTKLGDPIEARALGETIGLGRAAGDFCSVGSVKTNIGHLEAAAGIAGLIKTALALRNRVIPPSLHFEKPNPYIAFDKLNLRVQKNPGPWPLSPLPLLAGISSFGFGGTNAHVVLEEAPDTGPQEEAPVSEASVHLLPLSARSAPALKALAKTYVDYLKTSSAPIDVLCYNASVRRSHHRHRVVLMGRDVQDLIGGLEEWIARAGSDGREETTTRRPLVFVFTGQGAQWQQMGRILQDEPVYQQTLRACDEILRRYADWSLLEQLSVAQADPSRLGRTEIAQPAICALQLALVALWKSWGIEPAAVVGHSVGEVAAAQVAGVLSLEQAMRMAYHRGRLMQAGSGQGQMAAVGLSWEEAQTAISRYGDRLSVAASNSPSSTVLSGEAGALAEVVQLLEQRAVPIRMLEVDYAFHSAQMAPYQRELEAVLEDFEPAVGGLPMISTVTGRLWAANDFDRAYWGRNIREPVRFAEAITECVRLGYRDFLEIGPHPVLTGAIGQCLEGSGVDGRILASLRRDQDARGSLLAALGSLYTQGHAVKWECVYPGRRRHVPLPAYPWQRQRYWRDQSQSNSFQGKGAFDRAATSKTHPHLRNCTSLATEPGVHLWNATVDTGHFLFLKDHRVEGSVVLPAASYAEFALAAGTEFRSLPDLTLENMAFEKPLILEEEESQTMQLVVSAQSAAKFTLQFFCRNSTRIDSQEPWIRHATGTLRLSSGQANSARRDQPSLNEIRERCRQNLSGMDYYAASRARGLEYGPSFQWIHSIWRRDGEALAELRYAQGMSTAVDGYQVHPALLDACFQVMGAALLQSGANAHADDVYLPVRWRALRVLRNPSKENELWAHVVLDPDSMSKDTERPAADIFLLNGDGETVLEVRDMRLQRIDAPHAHKKEIEDWFHQIQWMPKARIRAEEAGNHRQAQPQGWWLIFGDSQGIGDALSRLIAEAGQSSVIVQPGDNFLTQQPGFYRLNPLRPDDFRRLLDAVGQDPATCCGVVHLWSLDTDSAQPITLRSIDQAQQKGSHAVMHLVQALVQAGWRDLPRLYLVTSVVQSVGLEDSPVALQMAPLWGLGRAISHEYSDLRCTSIDIGPMEGGAQVDSLFEELSVDDEEDQVLLRGDQRFVARFVRSSDADHGPGSPRRDESPNVVSFVDQAFSLATTRPGILDNLILHESARRPPLAGEVEIRVIASGLNFRDVMKAMGVYPGADSDGLRFGDECAGEIVAAGEGVDAFAVGDHVVAVAASAFSSYVTTSALFVVKKPAELDFHEAATIPIAFLTAYYALHHLGRLENNERVLIHAAAGGVGLAAIQLAKHAGAEIFATAGTPEKREFLRSLGVKHVADSRSMAFADEFMEITNGEGVDVVLNSLAGEAIPRSLSVLRAYGRFLEIGKRDIYQDRKIGLNPFQNNLSFFAIDMDQLFKKRALFSAELLGKVFALLESGKISPLPSTRIPIGKVVDAFKTMAEGKHVGKFVFSYEPQTLKLVRPLETSVSLRDDRSYLVTGGSGDLGLKVAGWMVQQGARHLFLLGRSQPNEAANKAIEQLRTRGAEVRVVQVDVAEEKPLKQCLEQIQHSTSPLAGIIHAAAVFDDGFLMNYDRDRFKAVTRPKIDGSWLLHTLSVDMPLDFFVLFSSVAAQFGSPGQGSYCAANAFLDALAQYRCSLGLPALSINWGPWAEVGRAAAGSNGDDTFRGIQSMPPDKALDALGKVLFERQGQISVVPVDVRRWRQVHPRAAESPLLENLAERQESARRNVDSALRKAMLALDSDAQRRSFLEAHLMDEIASVLRISRAALDRETPLSSLGFESLLAFEFRNRLENSLGVPLSATLIWGGHSNIADLAGHLAQKMGMSSVVKSTIVSGKEADDESEDLLELLDDLEQLDEEEDNRLLGDVQ